MFPEVLITALFLIIASIQDFKTKYISGYICYGFIFVGLILKAIQALYFWQWHIMGFAILNLIVGFVLCLLFKKVELWNPADDYFYMGLWLLFSWQYMIYYTGLLFIVGAVYGLTYLYLFKKKEMPFLLAFLITFCLSFFWV